MRTVTSVLTNGGARPPATASYCSAAQTPAGPLLEAPLPLLLAQPDCMPCPRPGLSAYYHQGATCLMPRALNASLTAWDLPLTADPRDINASAAGSAPGPNAYPITSYLFDWGDGVTASLGSAGPFSHSYAVDGTYTVCVTVSNASDNPATACQAITVSTPCPVPATQTQTLACPVGMTGLWVQTQTRDPMIAGCPFGPWVTTTYLCTPIPLPPLAVSLLMSGTGRGAAVSAGIPGLATPGLVKPSASAVAGGPYTRLAAVIDTLTVSANPGSVLTGITGCPGLIVGSLPAAAGVPVSCIMPSGANATVDANFDVVSVTLPNVMANAISEETFYSALSVDGSTSLVYGMFAGMGTAGAGAGCTHSYVPIDSTLTVTCGLSAQITIPPPNPIVLAQIDVNLMKAPTWTTLSQNLTTGGLSTQTIVTNVGESASIYVNGGDIIVGPNTVASPNGMLTVKYGNVRPGDELWISIVAQATTTLAGIASFAIPALITIP